MVNFSIILLLFYEMKRNISNNTKSKPFKIILPSIHYRTYWQSAMLYQLSLFFVTLRLIVDDLISMNSLFSANHVQSNLHGDHTLTSRRSPRQSVEISCISKYDKIIVYMCIVYTSHLETAILKQSHLFHLFLKIFLNWDHKQQKFRGYPIWYHFLY